MTKSFKKKTVIMSKNAFRVLLQNSTPIYHAKSRAGSPYKALEIQLMLSMHAEKVYVCVQNECTLLKVGFECVQL